MTVDAVVEGVHFRRATQPPRGRGPQGAGGEPLRPRGDGRAAALGAGGARASRADSGSPMRGSSGRASARWRVSTGTALVGGNVTRAPGLSLTVTVGGEVSPGRCPARRSGARPGTWSGCRGRSGDARLGLGLLERPGGPEARRLRGAPRLARTAIDAPAPAVPHGSPWARAGRSGVGVHRPERRAGRRTRDTSPRRAGSRSTSTPALLPCLGARSSLRIPTRVPGTESLRAAGRTTSCSSPRRPRASPGAGAAWPDGSASASRPSGRSAAAAGSTRSRLGQARSTGSTTSPDGPGNAEAARGAGARCQTPREETPRDGRARGGKCRREVPAGGARHLVPGSISLPGLCRARPDPGAASGRATCQDSLRKLLN